MNLALDTVTHASLACYTMIVLTVACICATVAFVASR